MQARVLQKVQTRRTAAGAAAERAAEAVRASSQAAGAEGQLAEPPPHVIELQAQLAEEAEARRIQELVAAATARLKQVCQVNRQLHATLVKKKIAEEELRQGIDSLEERTMRAREVELPARYNVVADLEQKVVDEQQRIQELKLQLGRGLMEREERAEGLTAVIAQLRETGLQNRAQLKEQHQQVKDHQRAVREMKRHIQIMDGADTPLLRSRSEGSVMSLSFEFLDDGGLSSRPRAQERAEAAEAGSGRLPRAWECAELAEEATGHLTLEELKQLPGLDLKLLLHSEVALSHRKVQAQLAEQPHSPPASHR